MRRNRKTPRRLTLRKHGSLYTLFGIFSELEQKICYRCGSISASWISFAHLALRGLMVHPKGRGRLVSQSLRCYLEPNVITHLVAPCVYLIFPMICGFPNASSGGPISNTARMLAIISHRLVSTKYLPGHILLFKSVDARV